MFYEFLRNFGIALVLAGSVFFVLLLISLGFVGIVYLFPAPSMIGFILVIAYFFTVIAMIAAGVNTFL